MLLPIWRKRGQKGRNEKLADYTAVGIDVVWCKTSVEQKYRAAAQIIDFFSPLPSVKITVTHTIIHDMPRMPPYDAGCFYKDNGQILGSVTQVLLQKIDNWGIFALIKKQCSDRKKYKMQ